MMRLSPDHISLIGSIIDQSTLTLPSLKEDVLDHLCCMIEEKMACGSSFEVALRQALEEFAPEGLYEIQKETDDLLNTKNIIVMKKFIYSSGLATSMSIAMGLMMKLLHMPGGEELINFGFLGFALIFMPMLLVSRYRSGRTREFHEKFRLGFAVVSALLTGIAVLLKMTMNLEWSGTMLMIGASVFSFGFLPLHFYGMYKKAGLQSA